MVRPFKIPALGSAQRSSKRNRETIKRNEETIYDLNECLIDSNNNKDFRVENTPNVLKT